MPSRAPKINIREKERNLLRYLYEYKVANAKQINRDIYPGITHQALYKRLNLLARARLIRTGFHRELHGRLLYSLSGQGFRMFAGDTIILKLRHEWQSASPLHDLDLLEIGERLKRSKSVTEYWTENYLKSGLISEMDPDVREIASIRPDAALRIRSEGNRLVLPLEYERSLKFAPRYDALFKKYYARGNIPAVLFIAKTEDLARKVKALERRYRRDQPGKFLYTVLSEGDALCDMMKFTNLQNESLILS
jgi:DNA-binding HxlR family transcriptional regulator